MKILILVIGIGSSLLLNLGCGSNPEAFTDKKLVIASKQTVKRKELDLTITNNGCGREWVAEEGRPAAERPYCGLVIRHHDSTIYAGSDFKPFIIDNIELTLDKINPWGREEDSVPAGGCRLWIKKRNIP